MKFNRSVLLLSVFATLLICGCGENNAIKTDQKNLAKATTMRDLYNKAHGDYASLSPGDKDAFVKLTGGEAAAEKQWQNMAPQKVSAAASSADPRGR